MQNLKKGAADDEICGIVFDLSPPNGFGGTLRKILNASERPRIKIRQCMEDDADLSGSCNDLHKLLVEVHPQIVFLSFSSSTLLDASAVIKCIAGETRKIPVIAIVDNSREYEVVDILRLGVSDFIIPPLNALDVMLRTRRLIEQSHARDTLLHTLKEKIGLKQLIGQSPVFLEEVAKIPAVARCDSSVLISGETGTGKELFARAIHYLSPRAGMPFIPVNCGAIPHELVENELYGHARGAYSGATEPHAGLIHEANGGTLFLDEIDCLPLTAQAKLLRFLQEKEFRQLGSAKTRQADIRIIAASNNDLAGAAEAGTFRRDLFYRLNVLHFALPPLRERKEDITLLADHLLKKHTAEFQKQLDGFSVEALAKLRQYGWPGNVRELENVIVRAVVLGKDLVLREPDISLPRTEAVSLRTSFRAEKAKVIAEFEKQYMLGLLRSCQGNITQAAKAAQKNRRAFWELMRKHDINVEHFKPLGQ